MIISAIASILILSLAVDASSAAEDFVQQGIVHAERGDFSSALDAFDRAIRQASSEPTAYYWRGRIHFCLGKVDAAVRDLDRYVELAPRQASQQWERGIALYYAGDFKRGAKQFELYQTFHDNDVENSVWRFLCIAKGDGVKAAQATMLAIKNDARVPMMEIYRLYQGKLTPDDVLAAVELGSPSEEQKHIRAFYAHLYLGLWYEVNDKPELADKHMREAESRKIGHYMWNVAQVHNQLRKQQGDEKDQ